MDSLSIPLSPLLHPLPTIHCVLQDRDHEVQVHADDLIMFLQLAGQEDGQVENKYELSLMTATQGSGSAGKRAAEKTQTQLSKVREQGGGGGLTGVKSLHLSPGDSTDGLL